MFQEYYAAEKLLELLPTLSDDELKQDYLNYLKWTEAIALMLGLLNNKAQASQVVSSALEVDLMLGARLAGAVKQELQQKNISLIIELPIPPDLKVECLGKTASDMAIPYLIHFLNDQGAVVYWQTTKDKNLEVRWRASHALGEIASTASILELQKIAEDKNSDIQFWAQAALDKLTNNQIVTNIDFEDDFQESNPHEKKAITTLLEETYDEDYRIQRQAIEKLVAYGKDARIAVPRLVELLDGDEDVRPVAAIALGKLGRKEFTPKLVQMLYSRNRFDQMGATLALGELETVCNRQLSRFQFSRSTIVG